MNDITKPRINLLQEKSKPEIVPNRKPKEYSKKPMTGNLSRPSLIISKNVLKKVKFLVNEVKAIIISSLLMALYWKGKEVDGNLGFCESH